jgi:metal-responsive CopG/Arc/MetJ family transcriptional regulator
MSQKATRKKMGRPPKPGGAAHVVPVRIFPGVLEALDNWRAKAGVTRSEAVRQLIEAGLKRKRG